MKRCTYFLMCGTALFCSSLLGAPQYVSSVIEPSEDMLDQQVADLNGDGLGDLLLSVWSDRRGRELLVYLQQENAQFDGKPSQRIDVKQDIIAYGLSDLREEPGEELLFFTRNGAYSYSSRKQGYAGNLQKLFDWELLATVPERRSLPFIGRLDDYNNDNHPDLLLPGREGYGLFRGDGEGGFHSVIELPLPHRNPQRRGEGSAGFRISAETGLSFSVERPSAFSGLFPERSKPDQLERSTLGRFGGGESIVDVKHWLASVHPARISDDGLMDFAYLDDPATESDQSRRQFNVSFQRPDGVKGSEPDWRQLLDGTGEIMLMDFNGDGLDDVLSLESKGGKQSTLALFANQGGSFDFQSADQVFRFSGYEVEVQLQNLNGDNYPELIVSYYSLGAVDALRSGSMLRSTLIYAGNPAPGEDGEALAFARRPQVKLEDKFSADSVKGLTERPHFSADLSGDGRKELLALDAKGAVVAKTISEDLEVASEAFWRFVPLHLVESVVPDTFNQDGSADFLLIHQNAVTILVSQP